MANFSYKIAKLVQFTLENHIFSKQFHILIKIIFLYLSFFFSILQCSQNVNHSQENLAEFGYKKK